MSNRSKLIALVALVVSWTGATLSGCGSPDDPAAIIVPAGPETGSVSLQLDLGPGSQVDTIHYAITGSGGYQQNGDLNVASSHVISGIIAGIPAGSGYTVTLTASSQIDQHPIACQGSSGFDITPGSVTPVSVHLACHEGALPRPVATKVPIPRGALPALALLLPAAGILALRRRREIQA
jgi:hypothetical protein